MACTLVTGRAFAPARTNSRVVRSRMSKQSPFAAMSFARTTSMTSTGHQSRVPSVISTGQFVTKPSYKPSSKSSRVRAASEEDLEKVLGSQDEDKVLTSNATNASSSDQELTIDFKAIGKYFLATITQIGVMIYLTNWLSVGVKGSGLQPGFQKAIVFTWFLFNALRSRTFSPLNAARPKTSEEKTAIAERKRPSWMPPPLAFPIIWSTIALLRAFSSVAVFTAIGTLNHPAVFSMCAHLSIGDTWNNINNVEKRLGTAVVGVGCVLASVYNLVYQYWQVDNTAGMLIAPSAVWISIATVLVWTIWKINPMANGKREPLMPMKAA